MLDLPNSFPRGNDWSGTECAKPRQRLGLRSVFTRRQAYGPRAKMSAKRTGRESDRSRTEAATKRPLKAWRKLYRSGPKLDLGIVRSRHLRDGRVRDSDVVRDIRDHLVHRSHSPRVEITVEVEWVRGRLLCGFDAAKIRSSAWDIHSVHGEETSLHQIERRRRLTFRRRAEHEEFRVGERRVENADHTRLSQTISNQRLECQRVWYVRAVPGCRFGPQSDLRW